MAAAKGVGLGPPTRTAQPSWRQSRLLSDSLRWARNTSTRPLRRAVSRGRAPWLAAVPAPLRTALDIDGEVVRPLRVELGGGPFPSPGYVHVDLDWRARHLEHRAPVWDLPFADGQVDELLAVHVLEHIHPGRMAATLAEWHRVVRPGGALEVHVPNGPAVFEAFVRGPNATKWALMTAFFGYGNGPRPIRSAADITVAQLPDHKVIFDFPLLAEVLDDGGFSAAEDLSGTLSDRHTEAWQGVLDQMSLIVRAQRSN